MQGNEGEVTEAICRQWDDSPGTSKSMPRRDGQEEKEDRQSEITSEHLMYLFRNLLTGNGLYNQAIHPHILMKQLPIPQPKGAPCNKENSLLMGVFCRQL